MRNTAPSLNRILGSLHAHLSRRRRAQVLALILLMLAGIVAELATFGAIVPLLTLLANPQKALDYPFLQQLFNLFGWRSENILLPATVLFGVIAVLAACVRILLIWAGNKTSYGIGYDLGVEVYRRTLLQPYRYHVARNTSQIIAGMGKVQSVVSGLLMPLLNTLIAILMTSAIFTALILIDPLVACAAGVLFSLLYLLISLGTRRKLRQNGWIIAQAHNVRVQAIQEGLGGIRDILIDGTQELYVKRFRRSTPTCAKRRSSIPFSARRRAI
ncbi:ABC transporter transmembrane domain-containing protein [Azorhizophilus paspali]|uniref:ABC transporter transmembrane domain-containing protein n=1 Tax=Azorhizophilus paspali TaxID=69963 RepID=UPI00363B4C6F